LTSETLAKLAISLSQEPATLKGMRLFLIVSFSRMISARSTSWQLHQHFKKLQALDQAWEMSNHLSHLTKCTYKAINLRTAFHTANLLSAKHQCQALCTTIVPSHSLITRVNRMPICTNLRRVSRVSTCSLLSSRVQYSNLFKLQPVNT
jgi:hypothetical protein